MDIARSRGMEKFSRQKSRAGRAPDKIAPARAQPPRAEVTGEDVETVVGAVVGRFFIPEFAGGEIKVGRKGDRLRIAIELELQDPVASERWPLTCDLVIGPGDWHEAAQVFEVKAV